MRVPVQQQPPLASRRLERHHGRLAALRLCQRRRDRAFVIVVVWRVRRSRRGGLRRGGVCAVLRPAILPERLSRHADAKRIRRHAMPAASQVHRGRLLDRHAVWRDLHQKGVVRSAAAHEAR
eukprot:365728-Chlamydomonas_euryale.AAC.9